jgi:CRP-like cAMP-binding protein
LWTNFFKDWHKKDSQTVLTLKQVPIFQGLTNKEFREIEKLIHERTFQPDEVIFKRQAPGEAMYVILSGKVEIVLGLRDGNKQVLAELSEGDFFGELSLLDQEARSATAVATDYSTLLVFSQTDLLSLLERNPELGNKILLNLARVISARLRKTNELLTETQLQQS